tara:strand:- start:1835 stop:2065 length:231 start_codon:yes stop_codon:yes gene_type:complete
MKFRVMKNGIFFNVQYKKLGFWHYFKSSHQGGGVSKTEYFTLELAKSAIKMTRDITDTPDKKCVVFEVEYLKVGEE